MAKLEILTGKRKGEVIDLADGDNDIGNRKDAKIRIRDPWISYSHAKIVGAGGRFVLEDLGSSNGTWVNGEKVQRCELSGSTLIYLGKTKCRFQGEAAPVAAAAPPLGAPAGKDGQAWWDTVLETGGASGGEESGPNRAKLMRLEAELAEERGMRRALERYFDLPEGARIGDAAKAGELQKKVEELEGKVKEAEKGGAGVEAAVAEATGKLRTEHMTKVVELEGKLRAAETRAGDLDLRLKEKTEQAARELERVRESLQQEVEGLRGSLDEARQASAAQAGGDEALKQERERATTLERELGEARDRARSLEQDVSRLEGELDDARSAKAQGGEADVETLKTQLWAAVEEATKWKEEARQVKDSLEEAQAEADKAKAEHAQVVQEIDEISMEQIEIEEELNLKLRLLREQLAEATGQSEDDIDAQLDERLQAADAGAGDES
ncbi:MAG: FHA domain-containing protein [Planctomycetota bacterium]